MTRWQRGIIWLFTFGFGLVWVLAFLLPTEVGGGIDRHGMYAPDILGTRLYYTTGVRSTSQPLAEHNIGAEIVSMDLRDTSTRTVAFTTSPSRRDDFYGAKRPSVYRDAQGYHMFYIGLGFDERNRICMADSVDGIHFTPRSAAIFDPPTPTGVEYYTLSADRKRIIYLALKQARRVLHAAVLVKGSWVEDEPIPDDGQSVIYYTEKPDDGSYSATQDTNGKVKTEDITRTSVDEYSASTKSIDWKGLKFEQISDVRIAKDGDKYQALVTGGDKKDGQLRVALFEGPSLINLTLAAGAQLDGSITTLGNPAQNTYFNDWAGTLADLVAIVSAFGFGMGLISIVTIHGRRIRLRAPTAPYSAIVLVAVVAMLTVQLVFSSLEPTSGIWFDLNQILFYRLQFPLGSTMFGLLAAYLVSAAYRAFRIRTFDAAVLAAMAGFVMLTQVPTGQFLASLFAPSHVAQGAHLDQMAVEGRTWALGIANDAVQRAVGFGAFIGAIAMAMRTWLSLDRTSRE